MINATNHAEPAISVERLQSSIRQAVAPTREVVAAPPFTLFLSLKNPLVYFNYAIPDRPVGGDLEAELDQLRAAFVRHERQPRLEFIEQFAPDLAPALRAHGFAEEARMQLLVCTPSSYHPAPASADLRVLTLDADTPVEQFRANMDINNRGFDPEAAPVGLEEAAEFRGRLGSARVFSALFQGQGAGAGMYTIPSDGITELAGIATLEPFRQRGVATALTSHAVATAFANGINTVFLSAADARAGRVYERVGFRPFATMLAYIAPNPK